MKIHISYIIYETIWSCGSRDRNCAIFIKIHKSCVWAITFHIRYFHTNPAHLRINIRTYEKKKINRRFFVIYCVLYFDFGELFHAVSSILFFPPYRMRNVRIFHLVSIWRIFIPRICQRAMFRSFVELIFLDKLLFFHLREKYFFIFFDNINLYFIQ